jgi:hypothetical protein
VSEVILKTTQEIESLLDKVWTDGRIKNDYTGLENILVDICSLTDSDAHKKLALVKDAIDAYTKRGHFRGK